MGLLIFNHMRDKRFSGNQGKRRRDEMEKVKKDTKEGHGDKDKGTQIDEENVEKSRQVRS